MNVLLLALSTVPGNKLKCYEYQYENEEKFNGYYQLEPIPKFLNEKLRKEKNQKIDYIITLNTSEVENFEFKEVSCNKEDNTQFHFENITAKKLFEELLLEGDKAFMELPSIISIDIEVNNIIPGVVEAIDKLRTLKNEKGPFDLYIDIHGGPRNTQMTFQTILSLLKHESIYPKSIYTVIVNKGGSCTIKDETEYFEYIDFVVGMNEFLDFGKTINLEGKYLSNDKDLKRFTEIANSIAGALTLCDMEGFKSKLENMSTWIDKNQAIDSPLLRLFIENIQSDYGKLLDIDHYVIDEIEWCLKKGYLQQAMTLIESKMPKELYDQGIFTYEDSDEIDDCKNDWESRENYIFIKLIYSLNINPYDQKGNLRAIYLNKDRKYYTSNLFKYSRPRIRSYVKLRKKAKAQKWNEDSYTNIQVSLKKDDENVIRLLLLHYALKQERNKTNHAANDSSDNITNTGRYNSKDIENAIGGYVDLAKKIYK